MTPSDSRTERQRLDDEFESFVAKLTERDARNVRSHVAACEREETPEHTILWKRLACLLAKLAPASLKTTGQRAVQFFAADGEYKVQVFALEDTRDGKLLLYVPDTLDDATAAGDIRGPVRAQGAGMLYEVGDMPDALLEIQMLSAKGTADAPDYYKHLLGWNRRALKITLRTTAGPGHIHACEALCRLAVKKAVAGGVPAVAAGAPDTASAGDAPAGPITA